MPTRNHTPALTAELATASTTVLKDAAALHAADVHQCRLCEAELPLGPRPIVQLHSSAKILIASQAPGSIAHHSGKPFYDPSGRRLRDWLGLSEAQFYNPELVAIVPMGFCYPGKGKSGDLPPIPRCADTWREKTLAMLPNIQLTLVIGQYAMRWHLPDTPYKTLGDIVRNRHELGNGLLPLPHPSPRNNIWLKKNSWFEQQVLPELRSKVAELL